MKTSAAESAEIVHEPATDSPPTAAWDVTEIPSPKAAQDATLWVAEKFTVLDALSDPTADLVLIDRLPAKDAPELDNPPLAKQPVVEMPLEQRPEPTEESNSPHLIDCRTDNELPSDVEPAPENAPLTLKAPEAEEADPTLMDPAIDKLLPATHPDPPEDTVEPKQPEPAMDMLENPEIVEPTDRADPTANAPASIPSPPDRIPFRTEIPEEPNRSPVTDRLDANLVLPPIETQPDIRALLETDNVMELVDPPEERHAPTESPLTDSPESPTAALA